jgi:hypothetical protein
MAIFKETYMNMMTRRRLLQSLVGATAAAVLPVSFVSMVQSTPSPERTEVMSNQVADPLFRSMESYVQDSLYDTEFYVVACGDKPCRHCGEFHGGIYTTGTPTAPCGVPILWTGDMWNEENRVPATPNIVAAGIAWWAIS